MEVKQSADAGRSRENDNMADVVPPNFFHSTHILTI